MQNKRHTDSAIEIQQSTDFPTKTSRNTGVTFCALTLDTVSKVLAADVNWYHRNSYWR